MAYWSGPLTILGLTYPNYAKQSLLTPNDLAATLKLSVDGLPLANAEYDPNGKLLIPDNAVVRGADYNWKNQRVDQANLNIEREIRPGMVVDIGYMNVRGIHNNHSVNINQAPPTAPGADFNLERPLIGQYPQLGDIPISESIASSRYDAITGRVTANLGQSIYINASYAHGRNFSNGNNLDQTNINQYYGPTPQDIAHIFNAQFSTDLPFGHGQPFPERFKPICGCNPRRLAVFGPSPHPQRNALRHVTSDGTSLNNGQTNRPDRVGSGDLSSPNVNQWFDTSAFVVHSTPETYGNLGINPLHADGEQQLDSSLSKTFHITERQQLQFRADAFNTFNHPNFASPDNVVGDPSEGQVFSTSIDNRRMQFSLRYSF